MTDKILFVQSPEELIGLKGELAEAQEHIGQITVEEFQTQFDRSHTFLDHISWNIGQVNLGKGYLAPEKALEKPNYAGFAGRLPLTTHEQTQVRKNGFVITSRLQSDSFGQLYYKIYSEDLPVFITSDSILHAWHRSFDRILTDIEANGLSWMLREICDGMLAQISHAKAEYGSGILGESLNDAEYFLSVAKALVEGDGFIPLGTGNWIFPDLNERWEILRENDPERGEFCEFSGNYLCYTLQSKTDPSIKYHLTREENSVIYYSECKLTVENILYYASRPDIEDSAEGEGQRFFSIIRKFLDLGILTPDQVPAAFLEKPACSPRVTSTLAAIKGEQSQQFELFGKSRTVDFSQFKPRGKYTETIDLQNYFRAMMWCGQIDLRVAENPEDCSLRELGVALVLYDLLQRSGKYETWQHFDRLLTELIGPADSMNFDDLKFLFSMAGMTSISNITDESQLQRLQTMIDEGLLGVQQIAGESFESPVGPERKILPRSFCLFGQRFNLDGWALGQCTFDRIEWNGQKVPRRIPSCLDIAFSVLGNDDTVPFLVDRIQTSDGVPFRDGLPYQHQLAALRKVIDEQPERAWNSSIYALWLATLRELSKPTTSPEYPEVFRTHAWAMKTLNTQLASWTQLKHDTLLYAKQPYTGHIGCSFPAGYVEPVPAFWERFQTMVNQFRTLLERTKFIQPAVTPVDIEIIETDEDTEVRHHPRPEISVRWIEFLTRFSDTLNTLKEIACKQLNHDALSAEEIRFLRDVAEVNEGSGRAEYRGWYPKLFYPGPWLCAREDYVIADVHTAGPDARLGDPGGVLHQAIGPVNLMVVGVESTDGTILYGGPVFSHYEFRSTGTQRLTKAEWTQCVENNQLPTVPEWMQALE
ncbi:MAG: DUF3160 domain-containing protein [Acidobacteria bacterium]|nr:DUF3160 domain-containing protein [Acidobacteriota bacterium]